MTRGVAPISSPVLVVAPPSGDLPFIIPVGLIDLVRRLKRPVRGLYAEELTDDDARRAKIVVLPVHWYHSLDSAIALSRRIKQAAPGATLVAGGYTAGAYASFLLERSAIDYVVRGDSEAPFPALVDALLDGGDPRSVPGVSWRSGETPLGPPADERVLGEAEHRDVSWFPSYEKAALASQRLRDPAFLFPWVVTSRGCAFDCPGCYASRASQRVLCGRTMVTRPPEAVRRDLAYWSGRPEIRWVHFNADFVTTLGMDWAASALDRRHPLTAYYEWYRAPAAPALDLVLSRFERVVFGLILRPDGECMKDDGRGGGEPARIVEAARAMRGRARVLLYVTPQFAAAGNGYRAGALRAARGGHAEIKRFEETDLPPLVDRSPEDRRSDFDRLVDESGRSAARFRAQHRLLSASIRRGVPPYGLLWKLSNVAARLALIRWRFRGLVRAAPDG